MKLVYTNHLKTRLAQRGIAVAIVKEIFDKAQERYFDNLRKRHIVIARVRYEGKLRKVLAAYDKIGKIVEVITVHPISDKQITQRLNSGRWIKGKNEEIKN